MAEITGPPGYKITTSGVVTSGRHCADHGEVGRACVAAGCPNVNELELDPDIEDEHLAAMVTYIVDQAHEALEWIRYDGQRFANPHPPDEMAAWDHLIVGVAHLMSSYREHFPA